MLEDYFYENISNMTTDYEMFCLTQGAGELYEAGKFIPLASKPDVKVEGNEAVYSGDAYGINLSAMKFEGDLAWPDWLVDMANRVKERYKGDGAQFLLVRAGEEVVVHQDIPGIRECNVSIPITLENAPTDFYVNIDDKRPIYSCRYSQPVLLNTQKYHGIRAINKDRIVFQISYQKPYEEVRDMLLDIHDPRKCIGVNYESN